MAVEFKDVTSHSQGTKDRTPRTWEAKIGCVRLTVTRHIHYAPDEWIARSHPSIIDMELLQSKDIEEAKDEAVELLSSRCNAVVIACK
jgi:hypothetical protein